MIQTHTDGPIRTIVLDRPDRKNALTPEGLTRLRETVTASEQPVLYLTGAGDTFCAGADLDTVSELDAETAVEFARQGQRVGNAVARYDGVVIAGIDGPARGGGVELAVACDLRIATPAGTFAESGVSLGLFGAWGGTGRLPALVGHGHALDLALSGRVIDAETAHQIGLVSRVVSDPRSVVNSLADNSKAALRTIKQLYSREIPTDQQAHEAAAFAELVEASGGGPNR